MVSKLCIRRVCARLRASLMIIEPKAIDEWPKTIPRSPGYLLDQNDKVQYILMLRRDERCQLQVKYWKQLHRKPKHRESGCAGCLAIHPPLLRLSSTRVVHSTHLKNMLGTWRSSYLLRSHLILITVSLQRPPRLPLPNGPRNSQRVRCNVRLGFRKIAPTRRGDTNSPTSQ